MTEMQFGRLTDLPLRDAWKHEAHKFTPWLAENVDQLSEAIGIPLEITGTEVAVESFSADILARNPMDDSIVLVENQLERTDHKHLGQIITYLAGLEAQTVVWIAPAFREPHLSAIRWLNEHTADGFSFFAVKARVVRIGDSPFAPIFEVVLKPDRWQRRLKSEAGTQRFDFREQRGKYFIELLGKLSPHSGDFRKSRLVFPIPQSPSLFVTIELLKNRTAIFVTSTTASEFGDIETEIREAAPSIEAELGAIRETRWGGALFTSTGCDLMDITSWNETLEWHVTQVQTYLAAFSAGMQSK